MWIGVSSSINVARNKMIQVFLTVIFFFSNFWTHILFICFRRNRFEDGKDGHPSLLNCTCRLVLLNWKPPATSSCTPKDSERWKTFTTFCKSPTIAESKTLTLLPPKQSSWPNTMNNSSNCSGCQKTIFSTHLPGTNTTFCARSTTRA